MSYFKIPKQKNKGAAAMPIVIALGVLIVIVVLGVTAISGADGFMTQAAYQSTRANFFAEAGAREALTRVARDKNYTCSTADCYSLDMATAGCSLGTGCASMSVSAGVGTILDPKIITAKGVSGASIHTLQVNVVFDASGNGEIASTTWQEIGN